MLHDTKKSIYTAMVLMAGAIVLLYWVLPEGKLSELAYKRSDGAVSTTCCIK